MADPPTFETVNSKVWFLRTADDTGGEVHEQRVEYSPDTRFPPTHYHPLQDERFAIESGEMVAIVDGQKRLLSMKVMRFQIGRCCLFEGPAP